jgi:hypothetical protein
VGSAQAAGEVLIERRTNIESGNDHPRFNGGLAGSGPGQ